MKTYSFLDVNCAMVGPGLMVSLGAGAAVSSEGISFSFTGNINTPTIGADGEGMNSLRADKSGRIVVRLLKSSPTNAILMAAVALQRMNSSMHGQNTITLFDRNKGDSITAQQVAFEKIPDLTFATEAQPVEWTFTAIKMDPILGA